MSLSRPSCIVSNGPRSWPVYFTSQEKQKSAFQRKSAKSRVVELTEQQEGNCRNLTVQSAPIEIFAVPIKRCLVGFSGTPDPLTRPGHLPLSAEARQALFYKPLSTAPASFLPVVHHPEIESARVDFGYFYNKPAGIYLSIEQQGKVKEALSNWPVKDVCYVCIRAGGRIFDLGRLGASGMVTPLSKPELQMACATVAPDGLLPLLLDCGTDNAKLLEDPLYPGLKHKRSPTEKLDSFIAELVRAAHELYPGCWIHFEDWKGMEASRLAKYYVDSISGDKNGRPNTGSRAYGGNLRCV